MCTLAIYFRVFPDYPVVVAANRDEFLARPATAPVRLAEHPIVVGGKDLKAGGTWLGLNEYGMVAGLLNRRSNLGAESELRSRGLLCLEALGCRSVAEAEDYVRTQNGRDYNYFNLLVASRDGAFVAYNRDGVIEIARLEPGLHLLTNLDVNDFECPKISRSYARFAELAKDPGKPREAAQMRRELAQILADHATQLDNRGSRPNALCLHLEGYGTRSSSLIMLGCEAGDVEHYFASGPPCTTAYEPAELPAAPVVAQRCSK